MGYGIAASRAALPPASPSPFLCFLRAEEVQLPSAPGLAQEQSGAASGGHWA